VPLFCLILLTAAGALASLAFACATPFAAFGALAAQMLPVPAVLGLILIAAYLAYEVVLFAFTPALGGAFFDLSDHRSHWAAERIVDDRVGRGLPSFPTTNPRPLPSNGVVSTVRNASSTARRSPTGAAAR
jgi:hypothetical protein